MRPPAHAGDRRLRRRPAGRRFGLPRPADLLALPPRLQPAGRGGAGPPPSAPTGMTPRSCTGPPRPPMSGRRSPCTSTPGTCSTSSIATSRATTASTTCCRTPTGRKPSPSPSTTATSWGPVCPGPSWKPRPTRAPHPGSPTPAPASPRCRAAPPSSQVGPPVEGPVDRAQRQARPPRGPGAFQSRADHAGPQVTAV